MMFVLVFPIVRIVVYETSVCNDMGESWNIQGLEDILSPSLENGEKISNEKKSRLTAPGDNYSCIMLSVDLTIKNERTGKERTLNTVAKLIPESEAAQEVFQTQLTYRNEYKFYALIAPTLDKLLKSKGITSGADFIPRFYGGRINLDGSETVTSDGVIVMENLKPAGYSIGKKAIGLNIEESKLILNTLAKFHAAGLALINQDPETFKEKVEPYFHFYIPESTLYDMAINKVAEELVNWGFTKEEADAVAVFKEKETEKPDVDKTWGTIIHYDSWTNNYMIKYEGTKPVHTMLVDFQVCDYKSPLNDVMFYLFTSVQQDIFDESVDILLDYYYERLLDYLKRLGVDTKPFSRDSFEEQIKYAVQHSEFGHCLWMFFPIMHEAFKSVEDIANINTNWSKEHIQRIIKVTRMCFRKGWLKVK